MKCNSSIMKTNRISLFILFFTIPFISQGQDNGLGIRVMNLPDVAGVGVSMKHMIHGRMSYEVTVGSDVNINSAFIKADFNLVQRPVGIQGLDWYSGLGAQTWFTESSFDIAPEWTLGLDWDIVSLPLSFFLDGSLYIPLVNHDLISPEWQIGAGVRVLFK